MSVTHFDGPIAQGAGSMISITADTTLTDAHNGAVVLLDAVGEAITLPAPSAGYKVKFILTADTATSDWVITATGAIIEGSVTAGGIVVLAAAETAITIDQSAGPLHGDWIELISDGTSWFVSGQMSVTLAVSFA
jgi:hypothetical protein